MCIRDRQSVDFYKCECNIGCRSGAAYRLGRYYTAGFGLEAEVVLCFGGKSFNNMSGATHTFFDIAFHVVGIAAPYGEQILVGIGHFIPLQGKRIRGSSFGQRLYVSGIGQRSDTAKDIEADYIIGLGDIGYRQADFNTAPANCVEIGYAI